MQWLTNFSIKNPAAVIIVSLLITLGGFYSLTVINIESEPQVKLGILTISASYQNASANDVLENVTKPLEKAVQSVSGVKSFVSHSQENYSQLTVSLEPNVNMNLIQDELETVVARVNLPLTASRPEVKARTIGSEPMYFLAISNKDKIRSNEKFNQIVNDIVLDELRRINGVESIEIIGSEEKIVRIKPRAEELLHYKLTPSELKQVIVGQHVAASVGSVSSKDNDMLVRIDNEFKNLEQIKMTKIPLLDKGNHIQGYIQLQDVAEIAWSTNRSSISRLNQKSAVALEISKAAEGNIVEISKQIHQKLDDFRKHYPDLQFEIVSDRSDFVKESIGGMVQEGIIGIVLSGMALFFFLRHVKSTLIVLVSIPLSMLVSLTVMNYYGISINLMSLFGMTVAIGRVVDDNIVVIESINRHVQKSQRNKKAIQQAVKEVSGAITSSTLTTVAVFLPIAFVSGILGDFFKPFAASVVCSLLASLIVAVTVVPMLASVTLLQDRENTQRESRLSAIYTKLITWSLGHKRIIAIVTIVLFIGSISLAVRMPSGFLPELRTDLLYINVTLPINTSLETTSAKVKTIEEIIQREHEVLYVQSRIGANAGEAKQSHIANLTVKLKAGSDENNIMVRIRKQVEPLLSPDTLLTIRKPASGGQGGYQIELYGATHTELKKAAEMVKEALEKNRRFANVKENTADTKEQLTIKVDRDRAAQWGLSPDQVAKEVTASLGSTKLTSIWLNDKEFDLVFGSGESIALEQVPKLWIHTPAGQAVLLDEIVSLKKGEQPSQLLRKDGKPFIQITADILDADKGGVSQKQTKELQQLKLPAGVTIHSEGLQEDIQQGFIGMFAAMGAAVLLVFLVMIISFGNLISPLAILLSLPLASVGGVTGLWLVNGTLDMTVLIGFLMLIGIVVTNAIVLVDRVQQLLASGKPVREALLEASSSRLRPIIMTAIATIAAMLPLALGFSEGSLLSKGLSTVVIGGLLTSTLLTLIVVPVGYEWLYRLNKSFRTREHAAFQTMSGGYEI
ncbi:efflux RND transporter permease subunit [Brevibacillus sp. SYSU BS000544]|uniref:efflux RND transporter permease subunit n=1 Tax=Brevibacillus sp. SYSU BS000544 TaxID=3416443 RepID=UPI003CE449CE